MTGGWARGLGLKSEQKAGLRKIMQQWISDYPDEFWNTPKDKLARYGFHDVERVRRSARLQLKYFQEMRNHLSLTRKQLQFLKKCILHLQKRK